MSSRLIHQELDRQAEWRSDRTAFLFEETSYTFSEFANRTRAAARALEEYGVPEGGTVAVHSRNHIDIVTLFYACSRGGYTFTTIPSQQSPANARHIVETTKPDILFYTDDDEITDGLLQTIRELKAGTAVSFDEETIGADASFVELIDGTATTPIEHNIPADTFHNIFWTSGTTGKPKPVVRDHSSSIDYARPLFEAFPFNEDHTRLTFRDMMHAAMHLQHGLPPLMAGETNVLLRWFTPEGVVEAVQEHDVDVMSLGFTPAQETLKYLKENDISITVEKTHMPLPSKALTDDLLDRIHDKVYHIYATTEIGVLLTEYVDPSEEISDPPSLGKPRAATDVRLVRPDPDEQVDPTDTVALGEPGELICRGATTMTRYLDDEVQAANVQDGWVYTGDMLRRRETGDLEFLGRVDNRIRSGGINVYPENIERILEQHDAVDLAVVVGVPDEKWGERVCAVIVQQGGLDSERMTEDLDTYCLSHDAVSRQLRPKQYLILDSIAEIPRGEIGKFDRSAIAELFVADK